MLFPNDASKTPSISAVLRTSYGRIIDVWCPTLYLITELGLFNVRYRFLSDITFDNLPGLRDFSLDVKWLLKAMKASHEQI